MACVSTMQSVRMRTSAFTGTKLTVASSVTLRLAPSPLVIRAAQSLQGKVVSTPGEKTAVIAVDSFPPHPIYQKRTRKTKKYIVHDENNVCSVGDTVIFEPCRPLSKRKRFTVGKIVKQAV